MQYTSLGRSGLQVSRLALGTMNFGELTDQTAAFQIMDAAIDAGINFFDTADVYGGPQRPDMEKGYGTSEEIIGRWLDSDRKKADLCGVSCKARAGRYDCHHGWSATISGSRGRRVNVGSGTTVCPGTSSTRKRWAMVASTSGPSSKANVLPMHTRGPPPNGK